PKVIGRDVEEGDDLAAQHLTAEEEVPVGLILDVGRHHKSRPALLGFEGPHPVPAADVEDSLVPVVDLSAHRADKVPERVVVKARGDNLVPEIDLVVPVRVRGDDLPELLGIVDVPHAFSSETAYRFRFRAELRPAMQNPALILSRPQVLRGTDRVPASRSSGRHLLRLDRKCSTPSNFALNLSSSRRVSADINRFPWQTNCLKVGKGTSFVEAIDQNCGRRSARHRNRPRSPPSRADASLP